MAEETRDELWTVRECECGAIHDRPDAGCPECGSLDYETHEVEPVARADKAIEALRAAVERIEELEGALRQGASARTRAALEDRFDNGRRSRATLADLEDQPVSETPGGVG